MSLYMPANAEAHFDTEYRDEQWERSIQYIEDKQFEDAKFEVISKFYEGQMTWSAAEAMAKLWAKAVREDEWNDEEARLIAVKLDLDVKDAHAAVGDKKKFKNEMAKNEFWR